MFKQEFKEFIIKKLAHNKYAFNTKELRKRLYIEMIESIALFELADKLEKENIQTDISLPCYVMVNTNDLHRSLIMKFLELFEKYGIKEYQDIDILQDVDIVGEIERDGLYAKIKKIVSNV